MDNAGIQFSIKVLYESGKMKKFENIDEAFKEAYKNPYARYIDVRKTYEDHLLCELRLRKTQPEPFTTVWIDELSDSDSEEKTGNEWKHIIKNL